MTRWGDKVLWNRATNWLKKYRPVTIAVAGSLGKTTTKMAIAQVFGRQPDLYIPKQSYSGPRGVAKAILGVEGEHGESWVSLLAKSLVEEVSQEEPKKIVLEIGAEAPGEIDQLAWQVPWQIVVVTNVGMRNLDKFVDKTRVAHEIESLVASLPPEGIAILNIDDELVDAMRQRAKCHVITYGGASDADVRAVRVERMNSGGLAGEISVHGRSYEINLPHLISRHQLGSILAALTLAHLYKVNLRDAIERLQSFVPPAGRSSLVKGGSGLRIIDSTFDATPDSVMSDLGTLRALEAKRKIAILGDLSNLGRFNIKEHKKVGKFAGEVAHVVIGVGKEIKPGLVEASYTGCDVHSFNTPREAIKWFNEFLKPDDLVLVTGSKQMKMKQIVERLKDSEV